MSEYVTFKVTVPHTTGLRYHEWFFPNGWRGIGPVEQRDRAGHRKGKRVGYYADWFVLACNNIDCAGRAVVPVRFLTDHADANDAEATR
jgi:hypothetical protein